MEVSFKVTMKI